MSVFPKTILHFYKERCMISRQVKPTVPSSKEKMGSAGFVVRLLDAGKTGHFWQGRGTASFGRKE